ncbi:MAG: IS481 family transposase [Chloroflexi bacterium]|nr:IS481 family transposase [Chloroflexota bacterium]
MISDFLSGQYSVAALSRRFGVSRKTVYKWLARFAAEGEQGLTERSRQPRASPHQTPRSVEDLVVQARLVHPAWGGRKLQRWLANQGHSSLPSPSTITAILRRHGLLDPAQQSAHRPCQRFERPQPNELWQMDFKGDFALGSGRCFPLTMLDDHSRFLLTLTACSNTRRLTVQSLLIDAFERYGLPEWILADNGPPWGASGQARWTKLKVWLLRLHIGVTHGRPRHPQTQGKEERLHRTLNDELLSRVQANSLGQWQQHFDRWRQLYNSERPHHALALEVPASRYVPSVRSYPSRLPELLYPAQALMRKVSQQGRIEFQGKTWSIGKAFSLERVALKANPLTDGLWSVYYGCYPVHEIDLRQG